MKGPVSDKEAGPFVVHPVHPRHFCVPPVGDEATVAAGQAEHHAEQENEHDHV